MRSPIDTSDSAVDLDSLMQAIEEQAGVLHDKDKALHEKDSIIEKKSLVIAE